MSLENLNPKVMMNVDSRSRGTETEGDVGEGLPVIDFPLSELAGFEPDEKMESAESTEKMQAMVELIKAGRGHELPPIFIRLYGEAAQVIEGHHRFHAYKVAGEKTIPAKIIPDDQIEVKTA